MSPLSDRLGRARNRFLDRHQASWRGRYFSAGTLAFGAVATPFVRRHLRGRVLDAGAGRGAWKVVVEAAGARYVSLDLAARGEFAPDYVGDVADMPGVPSSSFDCVLCHQVLEHVARPWLAAREFARVLSPGGLAIVSVPHLSRYHEWPSDYYRFTSRGLERLFLDAGFRTVEMLHYGGLFSFLHHQIATAFPGPLLPLPLVGTLFSALNVLPSVGFRWLDPPTAKLAPMGVIGCFAREEVETSSEEGA